MGHVLRTKKVTLVLEAGVVTLNLLRNIIPLLSWNERIICTVILYDPITVFPNLHEVPRILTFGAVLCKNIIDEAQFECNNQICVGYFLRIGLDRRIKERYEAGGVELRVLSLPSIQDNSQKFFQIPPLSLYDKQRPGHNLATWYLQGDALRRQLLMNDRLLLC